MQALDALLVEAAQAIERKAWELAAQKVEAALFLAPQDPRALNLLGCLAFELGDFEQARKAFATALARAEHDEVWENLGMAEERLGHMKEARTAYERAWKLGRRPKAALKIAQLLLRQGDVEGALDWAKRAIVRDERLGEAWLVRGVALRALYRWEESRKALARAASLLPDAPDAQCTFAQALAEDGFVEEAKARAARVLTRWPGFAPAALVLATLARTKEDARRFLPLVARCWQRTPEGSDARMRAAFAYGEILERVGEVDEAFARYEEANRLKRAQLSYSIEDDEKAIADIRRVFTKERIQSLRGHGYEGDAPIFIVGMPRSGTSLAEQILSAHPEVVPAGEVDFARAVIAEALGAEHDRITIERVDRIRERLGALGKRYVEDVRRIIGPKGRFTDKATLNFLFVGMLHLMLPKARFVFCRRDPLDNCFSIYSLHFAGELHKYAYDMEELGRFYRLHEDLITHWKTVLPEAVWMDWPYEALVQEPEARIRALISFVGLPWNDACLRFYESKQSVRTASMAQVRNPIYRSSVKRAERFAKHLAPLRRALGLEP